MDKASRKAVPVVVLLSSGLDSTFNLLKAMAQFEVLLVLTFDYGQKAAAQEIVRSRELAEIYGLRHELIHLPWFKLFTQTSLLSGKEVPVGNDVQINDLHRSLETAKHVWIPNRNGILLNIAAGFAEGLGAEFVIPGFNYEEAQTFPDNSGAFLQTLNECWSFSTETSVQTFCFSAELTKTQIVAEAMAVKMPFEKLWPCYLSGDSWCGSCESCLRFARALSANGLSFTKLNGSSE